MKPGVKSRTKKQLEQRRQAMLQLHLSDRQFYCLLRCDLYWRLDGNQWISSKFIIMAAESFPFHSLICPSSQCPGQWVIRTDALGWELTLVQHQLSSVCRRGWSSGRWRWRRIVCRIAGLLGEAVVRRSLGTLHIEGQSLNRLKMDINSLQPQQNEQFFVAKMFKCHVFKRFKFTEVHS